MKSNNPWSLSSEARRIAPFDGVVKADGSPADNDRIEIGPTELAFAEWRQSGVAPPNLVDLRQYRLEKLRLQLVRNDCAGLLLFDPLNIRFATDCTNMQLWITHNYCRACFIATEGPVVLWDFHGCDHLSAFLPLIDEVRHGASFFYFESGDRVREHADLFAAQVNELLRRHGGRNRRLALDKIEVAGFQALRRQGIEVVEGQQLTELARVKKGDAEMQAMRCAVHAAEAAVSEMHRFLAPGIAENELWSELHRGNIRRGGEWIETRLLSSGPRTNPWYQESGPRIIQDGDLVAFDTDLIGAYGYCVDISRTWLCGESPTAEQCELYQVAYDNIHSNMALLKPGVGFLELSQRATRLPQKFRDHRYSVLCHGVGLCDEYPAIRYPEDVAAHGYDGVLEPGMTLCVEAYVGAVGGREGVKLEEQVLITESGYEALSSYPYEQVLLR